jgi:hypothetical protein
MTHLNFLLDRINQPTSRRDADRMEDVALALLAGLLAAVALAGLL